MIVESTIFPFIQIRGGAPNLVLITIISFGLIYGKREGIFLGLIGGLISDILFGTVIGLYALPYMVIGYIMGIFNERVFKENRIIPFVFTIMGTLFFQGLFYLIQYLRGVDFIYLGHMKNLATTSLILNSIIVIIIYPYFLKLSNWHIIKEK